MKLTNQSIYTLANAGLLNTTEHDVPVADAYKASKFRRDVFRVLQDLQRREAELKEEAGDDEKRLEALRSEMLKDEVDINVKPMSYESFHALARENRKVPVEISVGGKPTTVFSDPFRACEDILEGVLWVAPEDD